MPSLRSFFQEIEKKIDLHFETKLKEHILEHAPIRVGRRGVKQMSYSHTRPEPKTKRPDLPVTNPKNRCGYCHQGQPAEWDGGACIYCGAPVSAETVSKQECDP